MGREFVDWDFGIGGVDRWGSCLLARSAVGSIADMIEFRFSELWFWRRVYLWNLRCWLGVCGRVSFDVKSCCLLDGLSGEGVSR